MALVFLLWLKEQLRQQKIFQGKKMIMIYYVTAAMYIAPDALKDFLFKTIG